MQYAVWVYNKLPRSGVGLSPEELFAGVTCPCSGLPHAHVFGCPVYVFDPRLQDEDPKMGQPSRQGIFIGFSPNHSSLVPLVLNPRTQHISPQFHVIFDDVFSTVPSLTSAVERDQRFEKLFETSRESYLHSADVSPNTDLLDYHWLSPNDLARRQQERHRHLLQRTPCLQVPSVSGRIPAPEGDPSPTPSPTSVPPQAPEGFLPAPPVAPHPPLQATPCPVSTIPVPLPSTPHAPSHTDGSPDPVTTPDTDPISQSIPPLPPTAHHFPSRHRGGTWKGGPALDPLVDNGRLDLPAFFLFRNMPLLQLHPGLSRHPPSLMLVTTGDWTGFHSQISNGASSIFLAYLQPDFSDDIGSFIVTDVHPHILSAKSSSNSTDSPTYSQAINSPHAEKWWEAMESELTTLESDLQAWELVPREPSMHVLPSTWAFRLKRFPNGLAKKFKARFCIQGTEEGFLGVDIVRSGSTITLLQVGLTKRIIAAVGLCSSLSTSIGTPAETSPLPKDADGPPASGSFNYAAAVGMLPYLSGHSHPDIAFAVHQCAWYTFHPSWRHELALIRIGRYLKGTQDRGLIMTPTSQPCVDCYPDADFAGLYGHKDSQDPHCARSHTGYVILAFGCPVLWRSCLQTEIALSTMEAEYVALSTACKDLLPLVAVIRELSAAVGLDNSFSSNIHCKVHKDNVGARTPTLTLLQNCQNS
eukprot:CCRYP_014091-RA/>CCRYP_014091-RA protein AED:0.33 eAED:0.35 QI:0/0/0/1/0/0/4/0/696